MFRVSCILPALMINAFVLVFVLVPVPALVLVVVRILFFFLVFGIVFRFVSFFFGGGGCCDGPNMLLQGERNFHILYELVAGARKCGLAAELQARTIALIICSYPAPVENV